MPNNAECGSYNCDPLAVNPPTSSVGWDINSCVLSAGTGGTFYNPIGTITDSLDICLTACTSWSCQNTYAGTGGCLEYPNTGNRYVFRLQYVYRLL